MTNLEFKAEIRNLYIESNRFNRFWAIALIIIGFGFLLYLIRHGINVHINPNDTLAKLVATIGIIGLPLIPIVGGLFVIYKIPRQFNPTQILSSAPIDIKLKLIESSLSSYKIISREKYNEINIYNCRSRYFNYFRILFYMDSAQFLFNIQTHDIGHYYQGVFDLGVTKRITRKIKACL